MQNMYFFLSQFLFSPQVEAFVHKGTLRSFTPCYFDLKSTASLKEASSMSTLPTRTKMFRLTLQPIGITVLP